MEDVLHDIEVAYKFLVRIKPELAMSTIFDNFGANTLMNTIPPSPTMPAENNQIINFSDLPKVHTPLKTPQGCQFFRIPNLNPWV